MTSDVRTEVVVGYADALGMIYFNNGTGTKFMAAPFGGGAGWIYGVVSADLNGDGRWCGPAREAL